MENRIKNQQTNSKRNLFSRSSSLVAAALICSTLVLTSGCNSFRRSSSYEAPMKTERSFDDRISLTIGGDWRSLGNGIKIRVNKVRRFQRGENKGQVATINLDIKQNERYFVNLFIKGASGESFRFRDLKLTILPKEKVNRRKVDLGIIYQ